MCEPVFTPVARRVGAKLAALGAVASAILLVLLPGAWFGAFLLDEAPRALARFSDADVLARLATFRVGGMDVGSHIAEASSTITTWFSQRAFSVVGGATRAILNGIIALFGLYFLLRSPEDAWRWASRHVPFSPANREVLRQRFVSVTRSTVLATIVVALLQGTIVGIGFLVVGLSNAAFWGVITAMVSVLPVMGSALVWLPAVLVLLAEGRTGAAVALAVIGGGIASNVDNIVRPIINRQRSDVHPLITIVGAFAGVQTLGLIGLFVGPLAIVYFFELVTMYREEYAPQEPSRV